ncbi:MAG: 2-hydroxy-3-oxopropionate reductase [Nitrospinota bacterium]
MRQIGFIGVGIMGKPMAKNLLKAGYPLLVYDIHREKMEELMGEGAKGAGSSKEVAQGSEVVITMLPDSPDVERAVLGPEGVLEGAREGMVLIDMSSINPLVARRVAAEAAQKGVRMLDAPVSGGEPGAVAGTLAIMVGGEEALFRECEPILKVMGKSVVRVGDIGAGNITKLANQIMVAINIEAMSEALILAAKAGVDPELVYEAVKGGLARSNALNAKAPLIFKGNFKPGFRIRLHQKDLNNALMTAKELDVPLPVTGIVQQMLSSIIADGHGDYDHGGIVTFLEKIANFEVRK